ncbi:MAG: DUF4125 family protein, partial [Oscillospiraceae bacterium]|nr:DUF4125 family protein [Oscillospiraceae bacterium]
MRTSDLFRRIIGDIPHTAAEFQRVPDENIACAVNGAVFWGSGKFTEIRKILRDRPDADRYAKLSAEVESMSKHGEYNAVRMAERGDTVASSLCAARYIESAVKALHLIRGKFAPYHKWLMRSLEGIDRDAADRIRSAVSFADAKGLSRMIDTVNALVTDRLIQAGLIEERRPLAYIAEELLSFARRVDIADKIIAVEWDMFDKVQNVGGRADCQDDWETFSIMRKSQYYCFDEELLRSILSDFLSARDAGRNVITEKYGYMMRYTVPEEFARIEAALPPVSEFKAQLIDAIVPIQV